MLTRHTRIYILKTRYAFGQSWFVGNAPHFDARKADTHISDSGFPAVAESFGKVAESLCLLVGISMLCFFLIPEYG